MNNEAVVGAFCGVTAVLVADYFVGHPAAKRVSSKFKAWYLKYCEELVIASKNQCHSLENSRSADLIAARGTRTLKQRVCIKIVEPPPHKQKESRCSILGIWVFLDYPQKGVTLKKSGATPLAVSKLRQECRGAGRPQGGLRSEGSALGPSSLPCSPRKTSRVTGAFPPKKRTKHPVFFSEKSRDATAKRTGGFRRELPTYWIGIGSPEHLQTTLKWVHKETIIFVFVFAPLKRKWSSLLDKPDLSDALLKLRFLRLKFRAVTVQTLLKCKLMMTTPTSIVDVTL